MVESVVLEGGVVDNISIWRTTDVLESVLQEERKARPVSFSATILVTFFQRLGRSDKRLLNAISH